MDLIWLLPAKGLCTAAIFSFLYLIIIYCLMSQPEFTCISISYPYWQQRYSQGKEVIDVCMSKSLKHCSELSILVGFTQRLPGQLQLKLLQLKLQLKLLLFESLLGTLCPLCKNCLVRLHKQTLLSTNFRAETLLRKPLQKIYFQIYL